MDNNKVMHDDGTQLEWKKHDPEILHHEMPDIIDKIDIFLSQSQSTNRKINQNTHTLGLLICRC